MNFASLKAEGGAEDGPGAPLDSALEAFVRAAVDGYYNSIHLTASSDTRLEDILRLLTLWFSHGTRPAIKAVLCERIERLGVDTWLKVLPQLIARIQLDRRVAVDASNWPMIGSLLYRVGLTHPQALVYPLTVAANSSSKQRKAAAKDVLGRLQQSYNALFDQAAQVSQELIRVAVLWHEQWHEALDEACRKFFTDNDIAGMFDAIEPHHATFENALHTCKTATGEPLSMREVGFLYRYGRDLREAWGWLQRWKRRVGDAWDQAPAEGGHDVSEILQAWDLYYVVYKGLKSTQQDFTKLELQNASSWLYKARSLEIAVPGTAGDVAHPAVDGDGDGAAAAPAHVLIVSFLPTLEVMVSKCKPRRMKILGSDGREYMFLLKGTEDLRQDERVMQLFGLVNQSLLQDAKTNRKELGIRRFSVVPLSREAGLVGWVHNCDTLHGLIKDYRDIRGVNLMVEHTLMVREASVGRTLDVAAFEKLTIPQKMAAFEHALSCTRGQDLHKVLWLKSTNAENWHLRRTKYTRSLAVMSMVGYILGLGDRHPSNFLLERHSGQIVHIDFGDCFEVAMLREKFPEKVPFRLTRMLVNAMAVCGTEGTFRMTCESVMRVLRENRNSVMTMLDAFVHDPLVSWNFDKEGEGELSGIGGGPEHEDADAWKNVPAGGGTGGGGLTRRASQVFQMAKSIIKGQKEKPTKAAARAGRRMGGGGDDDDEGNLDEDVDERLNQSALDAIQRVKDKLHGRDWDRLEDMPISEQIDRLIWEATSSENLCQMYSGWGAFF